MPTRSSLRGLSRRIAALLAVVVGAAVLAACGNGTKSDNAKADTPPGAQPAGFPRTLKHAMGSTSIPNKPKRVVVLDTGELDDVTMLGISPVGAVAPHLKTEGGFPAYLHGKVDGTKDVGPSAEPNLELIASLKPDLILSSKVRHEKIYGKLAGIAPTVFTQTTGGVWKDNLEVHAQALGLEKEAAARMKVYAAQAKALGEEIKKKNGGTMPTASVVRFVAGPTRLYQRSSFSGVVLDDIGLNRPASQNGTQPATQMIDVSPEQIDKAGADLIFVTVADEKNKTQQSTVENNAVWKSLTAVKNGKVFNVPDETWMSGIGIQAAGNMLADVAKATGVELPKP